MIKIWRFILLLLRAWWRGPPLGRKVKVEGLATATETFSTQQTPPQVVGIISPNYRHNPLLDALYKDAFTKRDLTQRTGP